MNVHPPEATGGQQAEKSTPVSSAETLNQDTLNLNQTNWGIPSTSLYENVEEVDKKNILVIFNGKKMEVDIYPLEKIAVLKHKACEMAGKKPDKMTLIFEGDLLDVTKTVNQYPRLRAGSEVKLIHAC